MCAIMKLIISWPKQSQIHCCVLLTVQRYASKQASGSQHQYKLFVMAKK